MDPDEDTHVDGVTGVHLAANKAHLECVNLRINACADNTILDDAGADFTICNEEDINPLLLAVKMKYGEVASALVKASADTDTPCVDKESKSHNLVIDSDIPENEYLALLIIDHGDDPYYRDDH